MRTWNDIWEYLRGDRTGKEANRLEREALSDPFLYEALEGLTHTEADHERIVCHLQQRIRQRSHFRGRKLPYWVAAASLLILGGVALLWKTQPVPVVEEQIMASVVMDTLTIKSENTEEIVADSEVQDKVTEIPQQKKNPVPGALSLSAELLPEEMPEVIPEGKPQMRMYSMVGSCRIADTLKQKTGEPESVKEKSVSVPEKAEKVAKNNEIVVVGAGVKSVKNSRRTRRLIQTDWQERFKRYAADSLRYPEDARLQKLEGEVVLSVRMDRKGHPVRIKIVESLSPSCDLEAVRLVEDYTGLLGDAEKKITLTVSFRLKNCVD